MGAGIDGGQEALTRRPGGDSGATLSTRSRRRTARAGTAGTDEDFDREPSTQGSRDDGGRYL